MTKLEKEMCENRDWVCFAKLTEAQRAIFVKIPEDQLQHLTPDGAWHSWINPSSSPTVMRQGVVYRIHPDAKVECEYKEYPVFQHKTLGGDMGWCYGPEQAVLVYALTLVNFAGIRYQDGELWRSELNAMAYGVPVAVRFTK